MSWDSYVDSIIANAPNDCDHAAIIGQDGSIWTTPGGAGGKALQVSAPEAATIGGALKSDNFSTLQAGGIHIAGVKYQFLRGADGIVLGKKKDMGAISCQKSKTAVVIGHTKEGGQQGQTNKAVGVIAEYLESLGM